MDLVKCFFVIFHFHISRRMKYTEEEDRAILQYIAKHPANYGGNVLWKRMELMKVSSSTFSCFYFIVCIINHTTINCFIDLHTNFQIEHWYISIQLTCPTQHMVADGLDCHGTYTNLPIMSVCILRWKRWMFSTVLPNPFASCCCGVFFVHQQISKITQDNFILCLIFHQQ